MWICIETANAHVNNKFEKYEGVVDKLTTTGQHISSLAIHRHIDIKDTCTKEKTILNFCDVGL